MKYKVYFEDKTGVAGGFEKVSFLRLIWWIWSGRIKPKENSFIYYITKIETEKGKRI